MIGTQLQAALTRATKLAPLPRNVRAFIAGHTHLMQAILSRKQGHQKGRLNAYLRDHCLEPPQLVLSQ
jgi:hypothetical protein